MVATLSIIAILLAACLSYLTVQVLILHRKTLQQFQRKELALLNKLLEKEQLSPITEEVLTPLALGDHEEAPPPEPEPKPRRARIQFPVGI